MFHHAIRHIVLIILLLEVIDASFIILLHSRGVSLRRPWRIFEDDNRLLSLAVITYFLLAEHCIVIFLGSCSNLR